MKGTGGGGGEKKKNRRESTVHSGSYTKARGLGEKNRGEKKKSPRDRVQGEKVGGHSKKKRPTI